MMELLGRMGARLVVDERMRVEVDPSGLRDFVAPYELVKTMRASILVLGPLVARFGRADVSLPGGCAIGSRPVNLHIDGLRRMGAEIRVENGYIRARAGRLRGAQIVHGPGHRHRHREPDDGGGAGRRRRRCSRTPPASPRSSTSPAASMRWGRGSGAGTDTIIVEGVDRLGGADYQVLPDRIETGTFLVAGAITGGAVRARDTRPATCSTRCSRSCARRARDIETGEDWIALDMHGRRPLAVDIRTAPYPGVPHRHAGAVHAR